MAFKIIFTDNRCPEVEIHYHMGNTFEVYTGLPGEEKVLSHSWTRYEEGRQEMGLSPEVTVEEAREYLELYMEGETL